jgi:hypothetical protein
MPYYMQPSAAGVESNMPLTDPFQFDILQRLGCGDRMQFDQLKRRELITLLGGAVHGRLPHARKRLTGCGGSAC